MGLKINNKECILSWAAWNDVPVTVPAFTDGFIGEILYEYNKQHPGLIIDCVRDVFEFTKSVQWAKRTAALIFGAGVVKHHIMNANLKRNGVEYAVYVNTGAEFEASDSGAKPTEAISWGKIALNGQYAKIYAEVSLVLPLLIAATFKKNERTASRLQEWKEFKKANNL